MILHHKLINRTEVKADLVLETALHIGTSQTGGPSNSPVIRTQFGDAFIPGSSMKGAFRSHVESLAHLFGEKVWTCFLEKVNVKNTDHSKTCLTMFRDGASQIQQEAKNKSNEELATFLEEKLCSSCQVFGGASWKAKLLFDDLHLLSDFNLPIELRDGVGIDRDSQIAVPNVKYDFEAVPAGSRFQFRLLGENLSKRDWALLAVGLMEAKNGKISIGGKVSRGLGSCHLENLQIDSSDFTQKNEVLSYFSSEARLIEKNPQEFLQNHIHQFINQSGEGV